MEKSKVLAPAGEKIEVKIPKGFDPKKFFKTGDGLYVWSNFTANIVDKAEKTKAAKTVKVNSFDLVKDAADKKIEQDLPKDHLFSETDVCAIVADLISKQKKGKEGPLLNNGRANLFYTADRVVFVFWLGFDSEWHVGDWDRDDSTWGEGVRVFSPATD